MALDRYTKLELLVRSTIRQHFVDKLSKGRQKAMAIPGFEIPRGGSVDMVLGPKSGTVLCLVQRADYVMAYKHSVGQLIGALTHYHQMKDRDLRDALRACQNHPDLKEIKQAKLNVLNVSKRLMADRKAGDLILALVTELPDVPQQAVELYANFFPIGGLLQIWLTTPVRKKKMCKTVEYYSVNPNADPPSVAPLKDAIKPMLKSSESAEKAEA